MEDALSEGGYAVIACSTGQEALRQLEESAQLIVGLITDIRLHGEALSGWDIARRARELSPSIGVVYVSADSGIDWRANGVPDSTFVQKPFAGAQIVTAISNAVNSGGKPDGGST